jgi:hypothetical protein
LLDRNDTIRAAMPIAVDHHVARLGKVDAW